MRIALLGLVAGLALVLALSFGGHPQSHPANYEHPMMDILCGACN
jgi:hypothetical protein